MVAVTAVDDEGELKKDQTDTAEFRRWSGSLQHGSLVTNGGTCPTFKQSTVRSRHSAGSGNRDICSKCDELLHYLPCIVQFMLPTPQVSLVATFMFKEAHEHKAQVVPSESEYFKYFTGPCILKTSLKFCWSILPRFLYVCFLLQARLMSSTHTCSLRFRMTGSIADLEWSLDAGTTTWLVSPDQEETCSSLMDMFCSIFRTSRSTCTSVFCYRRMGSILHELAPRQHQSWRANRWRSPRLSLWPEFLTRGTGI